MGLLDTIKEKAQYQWKQGEPYRNAAISLLDGNLEQANNDLSKVEVDPLSAALMLAHISPSGKSNLIAALNNKGITEPFNLGTITQGQAKQGETIIGKNVPIDVTASKDSVMHMYKNKVVRDKFTPEEVARFVEEAMRPISKVQSGNSENRFELINHDRVDSVTGRTYDSILPLEVNNGLLESVTVIPKRLKARQ